MNVNVDITGMIPAIGYEPKRIYDTVYLIAEMARGEWIRLAQENLKTSAPEYINAIQPVNMRGNEAVVSLVGNLPNKIENGGQPYDMKPGLLAGPHAKTGKSGRYNIVPFRHGTPAAKDRTIGNQMPITGYTKTGRGKSIVYTAAKKLVPSLGGAASGGGTAWGGKTGNFGGLGVRSALPVEGGRPGAYTWKHSPYESMYKVSTFYKKVAQNQYVTFRVVSDNSDPNSWWHPGFKAMQLATRVEAFLRQQIDRVL